MNLTDAIRTLDETIPPPQNKMVDRAHMDIAIAWQTIKESLLRCDNSEEYKELINKGKEERT
ncbi:MAG: hypothetical protein LBC86_03935 [Oscillospiraceae bacterium]|jgi:hypothetical protein|nr:hypothetical protein [Oscillospiraceae bacterium]